jgi:hypothetical protein
MSVSIVNANRIFIKKAEIRIAAKYFFSFEESSLSLLIEVVR